MPNQTPVDGFKASYMAVFVALNVGTAATTEIVTLYGSATNVIRVLQIGISGTIATAAAYFDVVLAKRSAVPTGGTSSALTGTPLDSQQQATSATNILQYTAAPTAGATVGNVIAGKLFCPITGTPALDTPPLILDLRSQWPGQHKPTILRGIGEGVAITLNGVTPANASSLTGWILYTEEIRPRGDFN